MADGNILRFPSSGRSPTPPPPQPPASLRPAPTFETFEPEMGKQLLEVARNSLSGARTLTEFIRENRDLARHAGIETLGVEVVAIMEGDKFSRVVDAIEEAVQHNRPVSITTNGFAVLKMMESLLAEASSNIRKFTDGDFSIMEIVEARARREADYHRAYLDLEEKRLDGIRRELESKTKIALGQAEALATMKHALGASRSSGSSRSMLSAPSSDLPLWIPLVFLGAIAVGVVVIAVALHKK